MLLLLRSGVDTTAPTITSSATTSIAENSVLSHGLTANEVVTWLIRTSAQSAASVDHTNFEIIGSTLRWAANGTKDFEAPTDTGANNTYDVVVRATDSAGNFTDQTITVTVLNVTTVTPGPVSFTDNIVVDGAGSGTVAVAVTAPEAGVTRTVGSNNDSRLTYSSVTNQFTLNIIVNYATTKRIRWELIDSKAEALTPNVVQAGWVYVKDPSITASNPVTTDLKTFGDPAGTLFSASGEGTPWTLRYGIDSAMTVQGGTLSKTATTGTSAHQWASPGASETSQVVKGDLLVLGNITPNLGVMLQPGVGYLCYDLYVDGGGSAIIYKNISGGEYIPVLHITVAGTTVAPVTVALEAKVLSDHVRIDMYVGNVYRGTYLDYEANRYTSGARALSLFSGPGAIATWLDNLATNYTAASTGLVKVYIGTSWLEKPMKVWSGTAWVTKPVKVWSGTAWVLA